LSRRELLWRVGPFAAVVALGLLLSLTSAGARHNGIWLIAIAAAIFAIVPAIIVLVPWERWGKIAPLIPVVGYYVGVACLRQAAGMSATGYAPLVLIPIVWEALYGSRTELAVTVGLIAATYAVPIAFIGGMSGSSQWRMAVMFTATGAVIGGVIHGLVDERYNLVERLQHQALHDGLTGLPNRRACEELLNSSAAQENRQQWLSFIDLDRFKLFNDAHGHAYGDDLLRQASEAWRAAIGEGAFLGRWGGEEFLLIYDGPVDCAEDVLAEMARVTPEGQTFSAGVVRLGARDQTWAEALDLADLALYEAKRCGRNRVEVVGRPALRGLQEPDAPSLYPQSRPTPIDLRQG
jgi:diguanylate cyclase (GGDEF)-like protein